MRAVLDTNVIVSALLKPSGNERRVLRMGLAGQFQIVVSEPIFSEYELVLPRPELKLIPKEIDETLTHVRERANWIAPTKRLTLAGHEADNRFVECADAGAANYLVTGNKRHFPTRFGMTRVVNAREFLEILAPMPG
jgi:uncharacterized protein